MVWTTIDIPLRTVLYDENEKSIERLFEKYFHRLPNHRQYHRIRGRRKTAVSRASRSVYFFHF